LLLPDHCWNFVCIGVVNFDRQGVVSRAEREDVVPSWSVGFMGLAASIQRQPTAD